MRCLPTPRSHDLFFGTKNYTHFCDIIMWKGPTSKKCVWHIEIPCVSKNAKLRKTVNHLPVILAFDQQFFEFIERGREKKTGQIAVEVAC